MLFDKTTPKIDGPGENVPAIGAFSVRDFLDRAAKWRPAGYESAVERRLRFLDDDAKEDIQKELQRQYPETWQDMIPVPKNLAPLVVGERSKAFKRSSFRLGRRVDGVLQALPDTDPQQRLFAEVWRKSQLSVRLLEVNRYTEALGTAFLKLGFDTLRRRIVGTVFTPNHVFVVPDCDRPTDLDAAPGVLLRIASDAGIFGIRERQRYEFWNADPAAPAHFIAIGNGDTLPPAEDNPEGANPYEGAEEPGGSPRPLVPVIAFLNHAPSAGLFSTAGEGLYDESAALAAAATDINEIGRAQGFGEIWIRADANARKEMESESRIRSPNMAQLAPKGAEVELLSPNPSLGPLNDVMADRLKHGALLRGLPAGSVLSDARTVAAAEALAIERISLEEYREESIARYVEPVERLWFVLRSVWNTRAQDLRLPKFADDVEMIWEAGNLTFRSPNMGQTCPDSLTQNEWRRRHGEGPLLLPDGTPDPDGFLTPPKIRDRNATAAAAASVTRRLGAFDFDKPAKDGEVAKATVDETTAPAKPAEEASVSEPLNGAQVDAMKGIVTDVAAGLLPRDAGVAMLIDGLKFAPDRAEKVMGSAGKGFKPVQPDVAPAKE